MSTWLIFNPRGDSGPTLSDAAGGFEDRNQQIVVYDQSGESITALTTNFDTVADIDSSVKEPHGVYPAGQRNVQVPTGRVDVFLRACLPDRDELSLSLAIPIDILQEWIKNTPPTEPFVGLVADLDRAYSMEEFLKAGGTYSEEADR